MIGTSVSQYHIISHIGAGGMGTVYLAEDTHLNGGSRSSFWVLPRIPWVTRIQVIRERLRWPCTRVPVQSCNG
jgi:serine/threonine protein kinase